MRMCEGRSDDRIKNIAGILCLVLSLIGIIYLFGFTAGDDIWYDEVFSMGFIRGDIRDLIGLTAKDVHPPLYYIYLKAVCTVATALFGGSVLIPAAKAASILPWAGSLILACTVIRKRFGLFAAGFFMFLMTFMPQLGTYYLEIRMYSFALLLITADILLAVTILCDDDRPGVVKWAGFCVLGILTAYTQYYACIAVIGLYAVMFVLTALDKSDHKRYMIKGICISALVSVVSYLPWIPVLLMQMGNISGNYWIQPLTLRSIPGCIKFVVLPVAYPEIMAYASAVIMLIAITVIAILFLRKKDKCGKMIVVLCLGPIVMTVISGFILSLAGTPIFVYRYMIPAVGGLWLLAAIMADKVTGAKWSLLALCPFIFVGILTVYGLRGEEGKKVEQMQHATEVMDEIPQGADIITNFDHVTAIMGYYRPDAKVYLYDAEIDRLIPEMFAGVDDSLEDEDIPGLIESETPVFFLGSFNSRDEIVAEWEEKGIHSELKDSMLIERYWINVYELSKD